MKLCPIEVYGRRASVQMRASAVINRRLPLMIQRENTHAAEARGLVSILELKKLG